jgi:ACS family hexuronate transporter-like MFS transporter
MAVLGLLWSVAWEIFNRYQSRQCSTTATTNKIAAPIAESSISSHSTLTVIELIRRPAVIAIAFAFFGYSYVLLFFLSWFPSYLVTAKHMTIRDMSLVSAIPWALGTIGLATGGLLSDKVASRTGDPVFSRKLILVSSLAIAAVGVALAGLVASSAAAVTIMGISVFFMYLSGSQYFVIVLDLIPASRVGTVTSFVQLVANCAGILAPLITGLIIHYSGSFVAPFVLAGVVACMGAVGVLFLVNTAKPIRESVRALAA